MYWAEEAQELEMDPVTSHFLFSNNIDNELLICNRNSLGKSETGPHIQRSRKDQRRRQATPDWKVAGLISKGTCV